VRLRNAISSSSLDLRFASGEIHPPRIKKEDLDPSLVPLEYSASPQPQYHHHLAPPTARSGYPYFQPDLHAGSAHALGPRMSLPQVIDHLNDFHPFPVPSHLQQHYVRRVQSYSALRASDAHRPVHGTPGFASRPTSSPAVQGGSTVSGLGPSSSVEDDMRVPNNGYHDCRDDGGSSGFVFCIMFKVVFSKLTLNFTRSEPPSATDSFFNTENISRSSESSESALPEPLSRSASELDLRLINQAPQYGHQRLPMHGIHDAAPKARYHGSAPQFGFYSPAGSIHLPVDMPSPGALHADVFVPQINGDFGNPWASERRETIREVELMYPSPVTPISLGSEAIDIMARGEGFYDYLGGQGAPEACPKLKEVQGVFSNPFEPLNSPLTSEIPS
jgi:hypothetical protein